MPLTEGLQFALKTLAMAWHGFAQAAAPAMVTALWQGAAVAAGLAVCLRLAPRMPAAQRFTAWLAGFAALVALPLLPLVGHDGPGAAGGAGTQPMAMAHPMLEVNLRWGMALAALWLVASLFRAVDLALHSLRLRALWKKAAPVDAGGAVMLPRMRGRRAVELCTTQELERPSVIGFFAPRILIPAWLMAKLTEGELDQIVLHETEHLRRRDDWTNLLQKIALVLFPLNPALWWMERQLCREREMACDEGVIRVTRKPRAYAACLTSLAERGLERRATEALSLGAWQRRPELVHRVHSILRRGRTLHPLATHAMLGALGCGLAMGTVELARCPQMVAFVPEPSAAPLPELAKAAAPRLLPATAKPHTAREAVAVAHPHRAMHRNAEAIAEPAEMAAAAMPAPGGEERAARAWDVMASNDAAAQPRQVMLKAEMPSGPATQQWYVLTTWQQVETMTEQDVAASSRGPLNAPMQRPGAQGVRRITVTRMLLGVYPANSISYRSAQAAIHAGWLVFEL